MDEGRRTNRRIGLLGGMSWESSIEYERIINTEVRRRLGGTHSADLIVRSYDFGLIEHMQESGDWRGMATLLADDAATLEAAGAEIIVLCTNTMHQVADDIEAAITVPFLHLADATAETIVADGLSTIALLGTRYTMERAFYRDRLVSHGLDVLVPEEPDRTRIHEIIYGELVRGVINDESRTAYLDAIERLIARGAEGVIAGCTEIELLVGPDDVACPYYPTTELHALAAASWALGD
jgi:aspartate racemase